MSGGLVEVGRSTAEGCTPVLELDGWRIAMLRHSAAVDPRRFHEVERHPNTPEMFVLTRGAADLLVFDGDDAPGEPQLLPMEAGVAYKVARSVWHHVLMSPDAHIVLFERADTRRETNNYYELPHDVVASLLVRLTVTATGGA